MTRTRHAVAPRCVVITGASRGLGAELARLYAAPGVRLGLIGRDRRALAETAAFCRAQGAAVEEGCIDVRDGEALGAWLIAFDERSAIELLVANAGISAGPQGEAESEGRDTAARQIETNLLGAINAVEPLVPRMLARRRGQIALVASIAAYRGLPDSPAYCASKAGIRTYGEALRPLLAPGGIAVCVVLPGYFASAMSARVRGPRPGMIPAARAAAIMHRGLARRRARIVFPRGFGFGLQLLDLLPARIGDWLIRRYRFRIAPLR